MPVTIRRLAPPAFGDRGCYNSPQLLFSQFRLALWRPVLAVFLDQNAPDRMLKVTNFPGWYPGPPPPLGRWGRRPVRPCLDPPVCDGGPEPRWTGCDSWTCDLSANAPAV